MEHTHTHAHTHKHTRTHTCTHSHTFAHTHTHTDPGNLIRTPDGRLAILDFGLICEIDDNIKVCGHKSSVVQPFYLTLFFVA